MLSKSDLRAIELMAQEADGDARRGLTVLEAAAVLVGQGGGITAEVAREALALRRSVRVWSRRPPRRTHTHALGP